MTVDPKTLARRMTPEEYFAFEATSETKHDYLDGILIPLSQPMDMAGGTSDHALISMNVGGETRQALKSTSCHVYSSDLRLGVSRRSHYSYPDIAVICGKPEYDPDDKNKTTAINPVAVIEVLSPSTEAYDRSEKFVRYLKLASLREYVLVSQDKPHVHAFYKQEDGQWLFAFTEGLDSTLRLRSLSVDLPMAEVYRGVTFPPPTAHPDTPRRMTPEEYFAFEETSLTKHDYYYGELIEVNGEAVAMAGGSMRHALITANVIREAGNALKGKPCNVYSGDLRVGVSRHAHYSYPDISIVCGPPEFDPDDKNQTTASNPAVVIEVLSPSTEKYDRSEKFKSYLALPALREYVLVNQSSARIESYYRRDDGQWLFTFVDGLEQTLHIEAVAIDIPLAEIYRGLDFPVAGTP
ncbi:MAG TPA: Uma2 family endonuclease [Tepidisphaeraceae bacterium]|jgi:Uma2 family endonuclease